MLVVIINVKGRPRRQTEKPSSGRRFIRINLVLWHFRRAGFLFVRVVYTARTLWIIQVRYLVGYDWRACISPVGHWTQRRTRRRKSPRLFWDRSRSGEHSSITRKIVRNDSVPLPQASLVADNRFGHRTRVIITVQLYTRAWICSTLYGFFFFLNKRLEFKSETLAAFFGFVGIFRILTLRNTWNSPIQ